MEQLLDLIDRLEGDVYTELFEKGFVRAREDNARVCLTAAELVQLVDGEPGPRVVYGDDRKRDEQLVGVHPRVVVPQMLDLEVLYRLYDLRRHQQLLLRVDRGQRPGGVSPPFRDFEN